jgi:N-acetyl-gamma-glutamyl-phosphate reductase
MELIPDLLRRGKKVIDLSADFRFRNADFYEAHYQPHTAKDLLAEAVYGLCEIYRDQIPAARLIGNPGCYPTSILLPLVPLAKAELIDLHTVVVDSKSGVSGAGRTPSLTTHYCEANESFKAYKVAVHRHNPEIDEILGYAAGQEVHITFVPHLVPMIRGMLSTIYVPLKTGVGLDDIDACLVSFYQDSPFVRLIAPERLPDTLHVKGTNFCDIGRRLDEKNNCLILISAIDNLVKGAAGQAVQNMNLMMGLDETEGLLPIPSAL